jgi:hypothetical protein
LEKIQIDRDLHLRGPGDWRRSYAGHQHLFGGLQFVTSNDHAIETGHKARVVFTLDDRNQTELIKNVVIQSVNGHVIGCRFAEGEPLEQALRFYLFP